MKVIVLGKTGQVARALTAFFPDALFLDRNALDLSRPKTIVPTLQKLKADCIINAAAYTAVDKAESESALAFAVNETAVAELAKFTAANNIWFIHFSTDYVFSGTQVDPYKEQDQTAPTGVYGRSKLAGEQAILEHCTRYLIFRTSWVFAENCANFVSTMLRLAKERDHLGVVNDQLGCPTYAGDIAMVTSVVVKRLALSEPGKNIKAGIYNLCCSGPVTWHAFAMEIFRRGLVTGVIDKIPEVIALTTAEYPTAAKRPANSILDTKKLEEALAFATATAISMPHWSVGLQKVLNAYQGAKRS